MNTNGKVLVTGCAGYIGSVLCQHLLSSGFEVFGVDSLAYNNSNAIMHLIGDKKFHFVLGDVRDFPSYGEYLALADAIIPLAAIVGAPACELKPLHAKAVNEVAIRDLLGSVSHQQRIIYPNTNSGYGQTVGDAYVAEEDAMRPLSVYAATKCEAEKHVLDHPLGTALRLATVFGPSPRMRYDLMVNDFTHKLCTEQAIEIFEPEFRRNFVHVRDVARLFVRMLCDHRLRGVFNVGLPQANLSKFELADKIASILNLPSSCVTIGQGQDTDKRNYLVSNAKLIRTGFRFSYSLEDGVIGVANLTSLLTPLQIARMRNVI